MGAIFERQKSKHMGSFASDTAVFSLSGSEVELGIVQNASVTFAQNISRIYDVSNSGAPEGTVPVYFVGGRTQGNATLGRVIGVNSGSICDFYTTMSDLCDPQDLNFTFGGGCGDDVKSVTYSMEGCVLTQVGIQVNSNDMIVNENAQLMFVNMSCN